MECGQLILFLFHVLNLFGFYHTDLLSPSKRALFVAFYLQALSSFFPPLHDLVLTP
jgi:hypothetical protein